MQANGPFIYFYWAFSVFVIGFSVKIYVKWKNLTVFRLQESRELNLDNFTLRVDVLLNFTEKFESSFMTCYG